MSIGVLDGGHPVEEAQRTEPGVAAEDQPHGHEIIAVPMAWTLGASFGVHDRIALDLKIPVHATVIDAGFTDSELQTIANFESIHHRNETVAGIGDLRLGLRVAGLLGNEVPGLRLTLRVAVSFPTGGVEDDPFRLGEEGHSHQHTFFGAGTVMPEMRFDISYAWPDVTLSGWFQSRLAFYEGPKQYKPSSVASGGIALGTGFGLERWTFTLGQEVFHEAPALWAGEPAENSGRTELLLSFNVNWQVDDTWSLRFAAKTPYATWSRGQQFKFPFLGVVGVQWSKDLID